VNLFNSAIQLLNTTLKTVAGEPVTYRRGNDTIDGLVLIPASTAPEDYSIEADMALTTLDRDWIAWATDLAFAGERTLPKSGDRIDWTDATGTLRTYLVTVRSGKGGRAYRHTDQTMQQLRIFTSEKRPNNE